MIVENGIGHFVLPPENEDKAGRELIARALRLLNDGSNSDFTLSHNGESVQLSPQLVECLRHVAGELDYRVAVEIDSHGAEVTVGTNWELGMDWEPEGPVLHKDFDHYHLASHIAGITLKEFLELVEEGVFMPRPNPEIPQLLSVKLSDLLEYRQKTIGEKEARSRREAREEEKLGMVAAEYRLMEERTRQRKAYGEKHGLSPDDDFISDWEKTR